MKKYLRLFLFFMPVWLFAQAERPSSAPAPAGSPAIDLSKAGKSVRPLPAEVPQGGTKAGSSSFAKATAVTRAVVIGISDYREPLIPDLRFADRDAEAFAHWLRDPEGCALPDSSIRLLTSAQATTAQMIMAMDWLIEASKPGDRAFLYFSGHGDVERVTKFGLGFLLSHDSPPAVYGAGAFSLQYLQAILSTLSENEVQVFMITDACRAGKLAGSDVHGTQVTATRLSQQFANEIKVLSCQPEEFSLEGEQWGGGRGCFSYHLEDALYGFADQNSDAAVDLLELRRYLEDHVSAEASPQSQLPMVSGPMKTQVATVREGEVAARKTAKGKGTVPFLAIKSKGMESLLLAQADSSIRQLYAQFLAAVDSGQLMSPVGRSANDYFVNLLEKPEMAPLYGSMKRTLAAALMDEGQTIINKVMQTDPQQLDNIWANKVNYDHLPSYYHRAGEILGPGHYVYKDLKAKELYFQALTIREENYPDSSGDWRKGEKRRLLRKSLTYDSTAAVTYYQLGNTGEEGRIEQFKKAAEIAPDWALIHYTLGYNITDPLPSIYHFKKSIELDSTFLEPYSWMAWSYDKLGQKDSATYWRKLYVHKFFKKMAEDSASVKAFECNSIGNALWQLRDCEKAKAVLLLGEKISDGKMKGIFTLLGIVYTDLLDFENAVHAYEKGAAAGSKWVGVPIGINYFYFLNDQAKAAEAFEKAEVGYRHVQFNFLIGNLSKCRQQAQVLIENFPSDLAVDYFLYFYSAEAARQMGMPDTANYYYQQIIEKAKIRFVPNPYFSPNYHLVALAYSRLGMAEELRLLLETAREKQNGDPWLHFNLACIYAQTGQEKAAIEALQKAMELGWQPNPLNWLERTLCDPLLNPVRETDAYKALVRKHFPKYYDIATRVLGKG